MIKEHNLTLRLGKGESPKEIMESPGHIIGVYGIFVNPQKFQAISGGLIPFEKDCLRSFFVITRILLPVYKRIIEPLSRPLSGNLHDLTVEIVYRNADYVPSVEVKTKISCSLSLTRFRSTIHCSN